jgi:fructokinase
MSVVSMGELLIDFVALESGVSVGQASGFQKAPGGAPANVAVAVKRLGHESAFLGQVGDDPFGHYLAGVLRDEGVDVRGLRHSEKAMTALAFVSLGSDGERSFSFYRKPSADMLMTPADVAYDVIDGKQIFHFGSITMISEPSKSATLAGVKYARDQGLIISYDPNLRLALWPDAAAARQGMLEGFEYASIVKISDDEVQFLTGGDDVAPLWRDNIKLIIVTAGRLGSTAYTREGYVHVEGQAVKTVDTTGAGDAFVAGLLHGILTYEGGLDALLEDTIRLSPVLHYANSVGALATTARGAIPALPSRETADELARSVG